MGAKSATKNAKKAAAQAAKALFVLRKTEAKVFSAGAASEIRDATQAVKIAKLKVKFQERVAEAATFKQAAAMQTKKAATLADAAGKLLNRAEAKLRDASTPEAKDKAKRAVANAKLTAKAAAAKAAAAVKQAQASAGAAARDKTKIKTSQETMQSKAMVDKADRVARKATFKAAKAD